MRAERVLDICRVFGTLPLLREPPAMRPASYRDASRHLAEYLGLDASAGQTAATELVAEGHLPRSYGRAIARPTFDGLLVLMIAIVARAAGLSRGAAAEIATRGARESFVIEGRDEPALRVSLSVGGGSVAVALPAGAYEEIDRLEQACRHDG